MLIQYSFVWIESFFTIHVSPLVSHKLLINQSIKMPHQWLHSFLNTSIFLWNTRNFLWNIFALYYKIILSQLPGTQDTDRYLWDWSMATISFTPQAMFRTPQTILIFASSHHKIWKSLIHETENLHVMLIFILPIPTSNVCI